MYFPPENLVEKLLYLIKNVVTLKQSEFVKSQ